MAEPARILVVDDEVDTVELIAHTLRTAGFEVVNAFSGTEALQMIRQGSVDMVLLDIMMPDIDGFEVMQQLNSRSGEAPPVVFFTAKSRSDDKKAGQSLGAVGYMVKPATRGQLLDVVRETLERRSAPNAPN